jgi:predicted amidohydrolase
MERYCSEAESREAGLVCFPECFLQGYLLTDERARRFALDLTSAEFDRVLNLFAGVALTVVFGMIEIDNGQLYNTAVVLERGKIMGRYRKTHLLSGERIFEPGIGYPVFEANGLKFGINICYDTNFPESAAALAQQGARLIVCPANNMMPRAKAEHWKHLHNEVRAQRAKETRLWLVSADVTGEHGGYISYGPTAVINPQGRVVAQVPLLEAGMVVADIEI